MAHVLRRLLLAGMLLCLLAACNPLGPNTQSSNTGQSTNSTGSTSDSCPSSLRDNKFCLTPQAIRAAYGVGPLLEKGFTGKGQTVIDVVSFGSPTIQQDMNVYDSTFHLPPIDLQVISPLKEQEYDPRNDKDGWAQETELDVQIIHTIAPAAKVIILTSPVAETEGTIGLPEFRQLQQYIIDHNLGTIVSQSWGASEITLQDQKGQQELQKWNDLLEKATIQRHITFFSSSGDHGPTDFSDLDGKVLAHTPTTNFAADSPWITSVGGTTLTRDGTNFQERAWAQSGGGFSSFYKEPDYQQMLPASYQTQLNKRRGVPDVAASADPLTGLAIYLDGTWTLAGGTSASAPVWAGLMAIANQMAGHPLGFINPALYQLATTDKYPQDFRDITEGFSTDNNVKGYAATKGWDPVTGLGSPNAEKLLPDLIAAIH